MSQSKKIQGFNEAQQIAVNPRVSAFVQANAGTGKTAVLTGRLLRILFLSESVATSGILCLTYTKAGASEMSNRILKEMRKFAMADDEYLTDLIYEIIKPRTVTPDDLTHARQIFYTYIDNPEILKVKTIHSFCEEILHRFPLEAGLSPAWNLVTDSMQNRLWHEAFIRLINNAKRDPNQSNQILNAFERVLETVSDSDSGINKLLDRLSKQYKYFFKFTNFDNYRKYFIDTTLKILDLNSADIVTADAENLQKILSHATELQKNAKKPDKNLDNIVKYTKQYIDKTIDFEKYKDAYLSQQKDGTLAPRSRFPKDDILIAQRDSVYEQYLIYIRRQFFDNMLMLFDLSAAFADYYKQIKREYNLLDFEDLILYTQKLFSDQDTMGWILSQLNTSVNHILVDEAQDTAPSQWDVITSLVSTILSVPNYDNLPPSTFVVGDTKQSIYSFQGAEPAKFAHSREIFEKQLKESRLIFCEPVLDINYRSCAPILSTVDEVFDNIDGFINNTHKCSDFNKDKPGLVEIHKIQDAFSNETTLSKYLDEIVDKIDELIQTNQFKPSDIMVLVRNRAPMAPQIIKKLKKRNIDVAGSDSFSLSEFSVVRDLLHLVRFCVNTANDYSLCCVLKSPLFGLKEDEIYNICQIKKDINNARKKQNHVPITIFEVLENTIPDIYLRLSDIIKMSDTASAYSFFMNILQYNNTRKNLIAALGEQIIEPLEEFLNICLSYERTEPGTMRDFIKWFITSNTQVKRDVGQTDGVRVITVHGSKGLQAGAVFLIDTATLPYNDPNDIVQVSSDTMDKLKIPYSSIYPLPWIMHLPSKIKTDKTDAIRTDIACASMAEYYRLLYVAMTRACRYLYIYGCRVKQTHGTDDTWINTVWNILARNTTRFTDETQTTIRITNDK